MFISWERSMLGWLGNFKHTKHGTDRLRDSGATFGN